MYPQEKPSLEIFVYQSGTLVRSLLIDELVEIGRADPKLNDPPAVAVWSCQGKQRLVIAEPRNLAISRRCFNVVPSADGEVEIMNIHSTRPLYVGDDAPIGPGQVRRYKRELSLEFSPNITVRVEPSVCVESNSEVYRTLDSIPPTPGQDEILVGEKTIGDFSAPDAAEITKLLRIALQVVQQAAGSDAFFQAAVTATTEIVDLDRTVLLMRKDAQEAEQITKNWPQPDGWCIVAEHIKEGPDYDRDDQCVSTSLLKQVVRSCKTKIHDPLGVQQGFAHDVMPPSLVEVECAVAAPILNVRSEVIGVLYGDRNVRAVASPTERIGVMEATLVEILAGSVAGGIARREEEKLRHTLSGFFSSKVADQLANDPTLMEGQDTEVSVLFCDVRGFSTVTEKVGPKQAMEWINDVMSELSDCVLDRDGVLVDYVGDELLAMWGAPGSQPDHAALAIDAARAMLEKIEVLRNRWADTLPTRFGAGIGINSGPAQVGNVGSRQKFKYGPIGNTVNLGSRLQSATKQLGVNCVASHRSVHAAGQIGESRRIGKLGVVGIDQPVSVYEIARSTSGGWKWLAERYHEALELFENQNLSEAAHAIGDILAKHPEDLPSRKLLSRVLNEMDAPTTDFNGVWKLTIK